jgi:hypothetical protein
MVTRVSVAVVLGVSAVLFAHEIRLTKIEETLFTDNDARILKDKIIEHTFKNYPPEWLRLQIVEIRDTLKIIDQRLRKLEDRALTEKR